MAYVVRGGCEVGGLHGWAVSGSMGQSSLQSANRCIVRHDMSLMLISQNYALSNEYQRWTEEGYSPPTQSEANRAFVANRTLNEYNYTFAAHSVRTSYRPACAIIQLLQKYILF